MTKLTDTQAVILSAAAQRDNHNVLPLPGSLRGGAATKVVETMIAKGFIEEVDADIRKGELVWRETGDGHGTTLVATDAGLAAIGIEPEDLSTAAASAPDTPAEQQAAPTTRTPREGTKQAALISFAGGLWWWKTTAVWCLAVRGRRRRIGKHNTPSRRRARLTRTYGRSGQPCGVALPYVVWGFDT